MVIDRPIRCIQRIDLRQPALVLGLGQPPVALHGKGVHLLATDGEALGQDLGGLPHGEVDHRVGQPLEQAEDRPEMGRTNPGQQPQALPSAAGLQPGAQQFHALGRQQYRRMAHGLGAARQDQVGPAQGDIRGSRVDGLHAGTAVALDGPGRHLLAAAEPKRHQPGDVDLVRAGDDAAQDHFVQLLGRKGLPRQERLAGRHRPIRCPEGSRLALGLEKGGAVSVDDIDRPSPGIGFARVIHGSLLYASSRPGSHPPG